MLRIATESRMIKHWLNELLQAQVQTVLLISIHIKISLKPLTHSEWILTSCFKITKPISPYFYLLI